MDYIAENWIGLLGVLISAIGLIVGAAGLCYAYLARRAAKSAEAAAIEARQALTRTLRLVDVQEAVGLISRLKLMHRAGHWDAALELYQYLRRMLSDIRAGTPENSAELRGFLSEAISKVTDLEDQVSSARNENRTPENPSDLDAILNEIQQNLEKLQSDDLYGR